MSTQAHFSLRTGLAIRETLRFAYGFAHAKRHREMEIGPSRQNVPAT
jgi:hypothetical protein